MILPSKKVLSLFILMVALVTSVIIAFGKDKSSSAIGFANNLVAGEKISIPENPNWQNELGKVNTNVAGIQTKESSSTEETTTDTVSTTLVANYLALKQSGTLNQESAQKLVDETVNLVDQLGNKVVLDTKLNIIADNGRQTVADYGENLGNILKNNKPKEIKNELAILQEIMDKQDPQKIEELQETIDIYKKIDIEIKRMPVPKTFAKAHMDMTVGLTNIIYGLGEIKKVFEDPLIGLQGMQKYQTGGTLFMQALGASINFINQNKIIYKQGGGGYYLLYGI